MALRDPKPGDGSFATGPADGDTEAADSTDPVPGGLSPTRTAEQRQAIDEADRPRDLLDPGGEIDRQAFPTVHRLAGGLAQDRWDEEFETALTEMLQRIEIFISGPGTPPAY